MPNTNVCEKCARYDERRDKCISKELCPTQNSGLVMYKRGPYFAVGGQGYYYEADARKKLEENVKKMGGDYTRSLQEMQSGIWQAEVALRERQIVAIAEEEREMERYGIQKTALGYRVDGREFSSLNTAIIYVQNRPMFTLKGDLHQMSEQKAFLERQGFRVGQNDAYPGLYSRTDFERAVVAIWENEVEGWANYATTDFPSNYMTTPRPNLPKKHEREKEPEEGPRKKKKRDRWEAVKV
jgi:hypothetical protein